jgi:hypothetical protein
VGQTIVFRGLVIMVLVGFLAGVVNVVFYYFVMHPLVVPNKPDEVAINTYVLNFFVGWLFFSAWFLARADEEYKKVNEAVLRNDRAMFLAEAPKKLPLTIRALYVIISVMAVLSFHLFHIQNLLVLVEIQFGVAFFVVMALLVLWDLDEPVSGVIHVPNIPGDWQEAIGRGAPSERREASVGDAPAP